MSDQYQDKERGDRERDERERAEREVHPSSLRRQIGRSMTDTWAYTQEDFRRLMRTGEFTPDDQKAPEQGGSTN